MKVVSHQRNDIIEFILDQDQSSCCVEKRIKDYFYFFRGKGCKAINVCADRQQNVGGLGKKEGNGQKLRFGRSVNIGSDKF